MRSAVHEQAGPRRAHIVLEEVLPGAVEHACVLLSDLRSSYIESASIMHVTSLFQPLTQLLGPASHCLATRSRRCHGGTSNTNVALQPHKSIQTIKPLQKRVAVLQTRVTRVQFCGYGCQFLISNTHLLLKGLYEVVFERCGRNHNKKHKWRGRRLSLMDSLSSSRRRTCSLSFSPKRA